MPRTFRYRSSDYRLFFFENYQTAKTIVWNGPLGKFEEKPYDIGTNAILHAILDTESEVVIGGGESLAVLEAASAMSRVGFVSSGGGAMLEHYEWCRIARHGCVEECPGAGGSFLVLS